MPKLMMNGLGIRFSFDSATNMEFPLASYPSVLLHVLSAYNLDPNDLARLEATCSFFVKPAGFDPHTDLSISELAALEMCLKRHSFMSMSSKAAVELKQQCGGSWKLVLKFFLSGEFCNRRGKPQAVAGPSHSIVVTSKGSAYSFGNNLLGQLGLNTFCQEDHPRLIESLQGIRIVQVAVASGRTMAVSDHGLVYMFGCDSFSEGHCENLLSVPRQVESLGGVFVVQVEIGGFHTAVLSREGRVYTISWGRDARLGHKRDSDDREPRQLLGPLENVPVVQIAAGACWLLALGFHPTGMCAYSMGCGLGGKLGHGAETNEGHPRLIEHFRVLNLQPVMIAAGAWHMAALGRDGRVCTWGWNSSSCLGHSYNDEDPDEFEALPKVVEALREVKAVIIATGTNTTFVVSDEGKVYSFGNGARLNLGHSTDDLVQTNLKVEKPKVADLLQQIEGRVVHISATSSDQWAEVTLAHTLIVTDSGKLYAMGSGEKGQLGVKVDVVAAGFPARVDIDLSSDDLPS